MAQAIVDPAELRRFAQSMNHFNGEIQERIAVLHGQLLSLGDSWRDQEHEKFIEEFEQTQKVIEHYIEVSSQHIPVLLRKAELIEEYLLRR